jgi:4-amino-4-deoxy-L-arabinose transferase-like glycosyltransferase
VKPFAPLSRREREALPPGVLLLAALALRLYRLAAQSLWYDEGISAYLAAMPIADLTRWTAADIQPPLYYYLLFLWTRLAGNGEFALRFPSAFFGVLTIPLLYKTGERLMGRRAALGAALLGVLSPLYVYYSQEARMYTLLTTLGLLSSYLLLKVLDTGEVTARRRLWAAWVLASAAAVYTHYFAFFLLAAQALYALCRWVGNRQREPIRPRIVEGALAAGALSVAYLPWLPALLVRYRADVSYWPGTLKLHEAIRKIFLTFSVGESVLESRAAILITFFALILLTSIIVMLIPREFEPASRFPYPPSETIFLLLYLVLPVFLILALSHRSPKFNPRYAMIASPAFLLLIAGGLGRLLSWSWEFARLPAKSHLFPLPGLCFLAAFLALIFTLSASWSAIHAWYYDPAFSKADFRGVADYVRQHTGPDETVLLVSGHMFPVFAYYYGPQGWQPIPRMETLDVSRTLDYSVADELNRALAGRKGAWLVLWQDEVIDPVGFTQMMLDKVGERLPVGAQFWHVRLLHYALPPGVHFADEPDIQHPADVNFADRIRLLGFSLEESTALTPTVTLFWQASRPLDEDYLLNLRLRDGAGHEWGRLHPAPRPAGYLYPTFRWKAGRVLFGQYPLPALPGTPPGSYQLAVGLYSEADLTGLDVLDEAGAPQGKEGTLGPVELARSVQPATPDELDIGAALSAQWAGIKLLGYTATLTEAQPGDLLPLTLFWQARRAPSEDYQLALWLEDAGGQRLPAGEFAPTGDAYPTSRWQAGEILRGQYTMQVPIAAQPGPAHLLAVPVGEGEPARLGALSVLPTTRVFVPPPEMQYRSDVTFGGLATLLGADLGADTLAPGETLRVTLYWRAEAAMDKSYTVFAHLLDAQEKVRGGADHVPAGGSRPTTGWVPGEIINDTVSITLDADAPPGDYWLEVGLYDADDPAFPRLPARDAAGREMGDRVLVAKVRAR